MKYLLFRADPGPIGLSNAKMALDIGTGLAWLLDRTLVLYENDPVWDGPAPVLSADTPTWSRPTVLDLFDVPVPSLPESCLSVALERTSLRVCPWQAVLEAFYYHPPELAVDVGRFADFRNGRKFAYTLGPHDLEADVLQVGCRTLGHYSYFFHLSDDLQAPFLNAMKLVRAKAPYRRFARELARAVAGFNALHLRRGDLKALLRTGVVTPQEILANVTTVLPEDEPLLILTDEPSDSAFFDPIRARYREAVFLDRLILDDARWSQGFRALPYHGDAVLALISQLVAVEATVFVGTLGSTFTGLIQRMRGQRDPGQRFLYAYDQFDGGALFERCEYRETRAGRFSWNRLGFPIPPSMGSWLREWPEAFSLDPCGTPSPVGLTRADWRS